MASGTFEHDIQSTQSTNQDRSRTTRPAFSQTRTSDRLHECERRPSTTTLLLKPRRSIFREEGLEDLEHSVHPSHHGVAQNERKRSVVAMAHESDSDARDDDKNHTFGGTVKDMELKHQSQTEEARKDARRSSVWFSKLGKRPRIASAASTTSGTFSSLPRTALIVFLIAVVVPGFRYSTGKNKVNISGADAGVIMRAELVENGSMIEGRQDSRTDICTRWAGQAANVNGTLYYYGGQAKTKSGQVGNTWNNNFITLDLTKSWKISSPAISALPQPSGPPAVADGYLWNSYESLFLYGGEFSDNPSTSPVPISTWEYNIKSGQWSEHANPQTSAGNFSEGGNVPIQRAAEGAGISVPEIGRSWYFGGHQDLYTTVGWSASIFRIYLKSLLEFTHPGYANSGVDSLGLSQAAPPGGVYRNITDGGIQDEAGFTERADGALTYIPGWGDEGIILGLGGGTNVSFSEMNIIDIYDIAHSTWYKQATSGPTPPQRVNPCTVVAAAPDGTSFNVYMYGGQNLLPFGSQIQTGDMWILTIPSFTWMPVNLDGQSQPPPRAGHRCSMWDGQIVVMGGYVGKYISCDSPGVYVFNASSLQWTNSFNALIHPDPSSSPQNEADSPLPGAGNPADSSVLKGSYGYQVPLPIQSIIGGSSAGGATATQPAQGSATAGPIATGKPPTFTVTAAGTTVIQTSQPTSGGSSKNPAGVSETTKPKTGLVAAGVIAGIAGLLAAYLAFCTWLYRRQLNKYKHHVAMAQRGGGGYGSDAGAAWNSSSDQAGGAVRMSTTTGPPPGMLGPFGTAIGGSNSPSGSAGRPSLGESSNPSSLQQQDLTPVSAVSGAGSAGLPYAGYAGGGGYAASPMSTMAPAHAKWGAYGRLSEEGEEHAGAEDTAYMGAASTVSGGSTNSSMVDLLGGQEPSFFSVVLNPRRTLRVVNSD